MSKARTLEKKKGATEKNVSLRVLQQHFSGSLKDAAKSIGGETFTIFSGMDVFSITRQAF